MARLCLALLSLSLLAQDQLTTQEKRGLQIFEHGASASGGTIFASLAGETRVPASVLPCVNCHGHDGQGRAEGGIVPSNITWDTLTKPYGLTHPDGRTHPAYTERSLRRAITMGIDPAGNQLSSAMPRFQLSMSDAADLIAYLKKRGQVIGPGLTDTTVQLGVILPAPSRTANANRIIRQALLDYFARVNAASGVFGRQIELTFVELPSDRGQRAGAVHAFLGKEHVFAVVGAITGAESEIGTILLNTSTPAIVALAEFPQMDSPLNRYVFYLDGGVTEEAEALLGFAAEKFPEKIARIGIISSEEENSRQAAFWLSKRLEKSQPAPVIVTELKHTDPPGLVFWLNPASGLRSFAGDGNPGTTFLIPASLGGEEGFAPAKSRVFVALHTLSRSEVWVPESKSTDELNWKRATASAEIMTEAMTRAGRNLTRAGLLEALEGFYNVQTSLASPITFGPNRRVGTSDVRIMRFDPDRRELVLAQDRVR